MIVIFTIISSLAIANNNQQQNRLYVDQIVDHLKADGYKNIRDIDYDDGRYEVKAADSNNNIVKLYVNPTTGEIMKSSSLASHHFDDDHYDDDDYYDDDD